MYQTPRQRSNFKLQLAQKDRIAGGMIASFSPGESVCLAITSAKGLAYKTYLLLAEEHASIASHVSLCCPLLSLADIKDYS